MVADRTDPTDVSHAHALDRQRAVDLVSDLNRQGRGSHPATRVCGVFDASASDRAALVTAAAIALEAGVRFHLGRIAGPGIRSGDLGALPLHLTVIEPPPPWEPEEKAGVPHVRADWRRAVAELATAFTDGRFDVDPVVPGAALLAALRAGGDRDRLHADLTGPAPRDEAIDPVATGGAFLAQALPDFIDLDLELRRLREARIDGTAPPHDTRAAD